MAPPKSRRSTKRAAQYPQKDKPRQKRQTFRLFLGLGLARSFYGKVLDTQAIAFRHGLEDGGIAVQDSFVIITLTEGRQHVLILDSPCEAVRKDAFQTIAHFNAALSVLGGYKKENAIIFFFIANAPFAQNRKPIVFYAFPVKGRHGKDNDLCLGPFGKGGTIGEDDLFRPTGKDAYLIDDINIPRRFGRNPGGLPQTPRQEKITWRTRSSHKSFFFMGMSPSLDDIRTSPAEPSWPLHQP